MKFLYLILICITSLHAKNLPKNVLETSDNIIPPALLFNIANYYDDISEIKCFYLDYYKLRFINLKELNKNEFVEQKLSFNICQSNINSTIQYNNIEYTFSKFMIDYKSIKDNIYLTLNTSLSSNNKTDNTTLLSLLSIEYICNNYSENNSFTKEEESLIIHINQCKHSFTFRLFIHKYCGIFSYFIIVCGFFCLIYGYSKGTVSYILYTIFALFEIGLEIFDHVSYFYFVPQQDYFYLIIIFGIIIIGSIFGLICSWSFLYKKLILLYFTGKVLHNVLFYIIILPLFNSSNKNLLIIREIVLVVSLIIAITFFAFVNENDKYTQLIIAIIMVVVGCYFITFIGFNFIGGSLPFDLSIAYAHSFKNDEESFYNNLSSFIKYIYVFIVYIILFFIGIFAMAPFDELIIDKLIPKQIVDSDEEDDKDLGMSCMKSADISKTNFNKTETEYE